MLNKARKSLKSNRGFTILELIVVVAIMGFLVALVAPKLVGVTENSKEPTCNTNEQRISDTVDRMYLEIGRYPDKLKNLIPSTGTSASGESIKETTGNNAWIGTKGSKNAFSKEFVDQNHLYVHTLSLAEINELKSLGIANIINLKSDNLVLMVGSGAGPHTKDSNNKDIPAKIPSGAVLVSNEFSSPDLIYRIVLGIGDESELVTSNMLQAGGFCPTALQNKDFITHNSYSIVLPRLKATVSRLYNDAGTTPLVPTKIEIQGLDDKNNNIEGTLKELEIGKVQDPSNFDILCPEGHRISTAKEKSWKITKIVTP